MYIDTKSVRSFSSVQARIQRGSSCSYITAMECEIITEMSLLRQRSLHRVDVFMSRSALASHKKINLINKNVYNMTTQDYKEISDYNTNDK